MFANIWISLAALPVCLALLILSSDYFVGGAVSVAKRFRLPEFVVGSLIVAVGTSAPELAINIAAGLEEQGDIVISNLVGSNIVNICLGLGLAGFFTAYGVIERSYLRAFLLGLGAAIALLVYTLALSEGGQTEMGRLVGLVLLAVFAAYVWQSLNSGGPEAGEEEDIPSVPQSAWFSALSLLGGAVGMAVFADLAVGAAVSISDYVGIPQAVIGATVIAAGGSLPEIFSCISAARRGMPNIILGNIAGSQIFNLFGILGATLIVAEVSYSTALAVDTGVLVAATLALFALIFAGPATRRALPYVLLLVYGLYGTYLVAISL
jgi:cation:H+ antiporter